MVVDVLLWVRYRDIVMIEISFILKVFRVSRRSSCVDRLFVL